MEKLKCEFNDRVQILDQNLRWFQLAAAAAETEGNNSLCTKVRQNREKRRKY